MVKTSGSIPAWRFLLAWPAGMSAGLILNGRFRLVEQLGRGGMGSVWRAEDMELEAEAAVKLIDPSLLQTPEALARFKREARAAAAIRSTHVVQILAYGVQQIDSSQSVPFIAMELLKGESLAARLTRAGRLEAGETLQILTHVARALSLAHKSGIVHRDLKPDNVFLAKEMDTDIGKVLDFGVARQMGVLGTTTGGLRTQSGAVLGTPYYMSPEQTVGEPVDARSDIWSFGVIAFECLTGVRPFEHETMGGLFHAICVAPQPIPSKYGNMPEGFDEWFARATARDKGQRFQSLEEAIAALRRVCGRGSGRPISDTSLSSAGAVSPARSARFGETPPPASQTIPGLPRGRSWLAFGIGVPIVVLASAAAYLLWHQTHSRIARVPSLSPSHDAPTAPLAAVTGNQDRLSVIPVAVVSSPVPASSSFAGTETRGAAPVSIASMSKSSASRNPRTSASTKAGIDPRSEPADRAKPALEAKPTVDVQPTAAEKPAPASTSLKKRENVAGF